MILIFVNKIKFELFEDRVNVIFVENIEKWYNKE